MKRITHAETSQIVMPGDANRLGRLFGGRLMEWIDIAATLAARRYSGREVVTAAIETLQFTAPAHVGDTILLAADLVYTGRTSMQVRVTSYVERLTGERCPINKAYFTLIALDDEARPVPIPPFTPQTEEEKEEFIRAEQRKLARKSER